MFKNHNVVLPHKNSMELFNSRDYLKICGLVIVECSKPSTGMGIEACWAESYGVRIVCFYKKGTKPSSSLKVLTNTFIEYINKDDLKNKIDQLLEME